MPSYSEKYGDILEKKDESSGEEIIFEPDEELFELDLDEEPPDVDFEDDGLEDEDEEETEEEE